MQWNEESWIEVARALGFDSEEEMLRHLYSVQKFSINQMSRIVGYSSFSVRRRLLLLNIVLRSRGGSNSKGRRTLLHLTYEELHGESPDKIAASHDCHVSTVFAEKRFRTKIARKENEEQLNALLPAVPGEANSGDGRRDEARGDQGDLAHGVGAASEEPAVSGGDEAQTRSRGEGDS